MKTIVTQLLLLSTLGFLASACGNLEKRDPSDSHSKGFSKVESSLIISDAGTIRFNDFEGGHYVIESDDGNTYLPTQLAQELQVEGLRVNFEGRLLQDAFMTQMSGQILEIDSIVIE
jgi:hypothetical protein